MPDKPWLINKEWAHRQVPRYWGHREALIVFAPFVALGCAAMTVFALVKGSLFGAAVIFAAGIAMVGITGQRGLIWRLRRRRYGESVCRLLTLPGVVGGWLKADVECRLPPGPEPVIVRLRNVRGEGKTERELWRMEQGLALTPPAAPGAPVIVPVRLQIRKKAAGLDFLATFSVPVYDTQYGDPAEQRPD